MKRILLIVLMFSMIFSLVFGQGGTEKAAKPVAFDYPTKELTIIVGSGAGGATDIAMRVFVKYFQKHFPTAVNVINIGGAGGSVAIAELNKRPVDGYTVLTQLSSMPLNHAIGTFSYTWEDFEPISGLFSGFMTTVVRSDSDIKTFADFAKRVKEDKSFRYGVFTNSPSTGILLVLEDYLKVKMNVIDIPETGKQTELLAGRLDGTSDFFAQMKPFIDSGDFRSLGVFVPERLKAYPDIPTFKEMGMDYSITTMMMGLLAPKGTPQEIVDFIDNAVRETYEQEPGLLDDLNNLAYFPQYMDSKEYIGWLEPVFKDYVRFVDAQ